MIVESNEVFGNGVWIVDCGKQSRPCEAVWERAPRSKINL